MKKLVLGLSLLLAAAGTVHAAGDVEAGKVKAAACGACHGADGNSLAPNFPKLAGQGVRYLTKQINDIKSGARPVPMMTAMVANLSEQDIADISAYFASQSSSTGKAKDDTEMLALGARVYRGGNEATGTAACDACHSPTGAGNAAAGFPRLGGQHAGYIEAQLKAFRAAGRDDDVADANKRRNDGAGDTAMMQPVAAKLSDSEIKAVANFIQGLH